MTTEIKTPKNSALLISRPPKCDAFLMLAHGAGAPMDSLFMESITQALYTQSIGVIRFEFDYMAQRRHGGSKRPPPKMPILVSEWQKLLLQWRRENHQQPLFIGGKSMGARVATEINTISKHSQAFNTVFWKGVVCLGYPFHPQKQPLKLRTEPLKEQTKPVLIVQGTKDAFGSQEEVDSYQLKNTINMHWISTGNHDLKPLISTKKTHQEAIDETAKSVRLFIDKLMTH